LRLYLPGASEVLVDLVHVDVKHLRSHSELFRVLVLRSRTTHHDDFSALRDRHCCMLYRSVRPFESVPKLGESKCFFQPCQCFANIFVKQIGYAPLCFRMRLFLLLFHGSALLSIGCRTDFFRRQSSLMVSILRGSAWPVL